MHVTGCHGAPRRWPQSPTYAWSAPRATSVSHAAVRTRDVGGARPEPERGARRKRVLQQALTSLTKPKPNPKHNPKPTPDPDANQTGPPGPADKLALVLEMTMVADVGLIGYPNAGKSTLLTHVTRATPKIADYPFTTLVPNLSL